MPDDQRAGLGGLYPPGSLYPSPAEAQALMNANRPAVCRICKCSELDACEGGCSWVEPYLCDCCALMVGSVAAMISTYLGACGPRADRDKRMALLDAVEADPRPEVQEAAVEFLSGPVMLAVREAMASLCSPDEQEMLVVLPG